MKFYCGIDLSARDFHLCVIDEQPLVGANSIYGRSAAGRIAIHRQVRPPSVDRATAVRSRPLTIARQEKNATPEYEK